MALNFKKPKQKQRILLAVFLIMLLVIAGIWWFGLLKEPAGTSFIGSEVFEASPFLKAININFDLLENLEFRGLQSFKEVPSFEGSPGRENPFLPY